MFHYSACRQQNQLTVAVHLFRSSYRRCFVKRDVLETFANVIEKYLCWSHFLIKCNFITKKFQHRCFPVKSAKFLRIPILKNFWKRLLLYFNYNSHHHFHYHHFHYHQKEPFADVLENRCS